MRAPGPSPGMTRHTHETLRDGRPHLLIAGWDRMLGHFFLDVLDLSQPDQTPEHEVYRTMHDDALRDFTRGRFYMGLRENELLDKAQALGVQIPEAMLAQLREDAEKNHGNLCRRF